MRTSARERATKVARLLRSRHRAAHARRRRRRIPRKPQGTRVARAFAFALSSWRHLPVQHAERAGNGACHHRRAGDGMQRRAMESHERAGPAEVARVIEIRRDAGNDQHGRAEPRQASASGPRERERRKRVCEGFHDIFLQGKIELLRCRRYDRKRVLHDPERHGQRSDRLAVNLSVHRFAIGRLTNRFGRLPRLDPVLFAERARATWRASKRDSRAGCAVSS